MCTELCCGAIGKCLKIFLKGFAILYMILYTLLHIGVTAYTIVIASLNTGGYFDDIAIIKDTCNNCTLNHAHQMCYAKSGIYTCDFEPIVCFVIISLSVFLMNLYLILLTLKNLACIKNPKKYGCAFDADLTHNVIERIRVTVTILTVFSNFGTVLLIAVYHRLIGSDSYYKASDFTSNWQSGNHNGTLAIKLEQQGTIYSSFLICSLIYAICSLFHNFIGFPIKNDIFIFKSNRYNNKCCDEHLRCIHGEDSLMSSLLQYNICDNEDGIECCICDCSEKKPENITTGYDTTARPQTKGATEPKNQLILNIPSDKPANNVVQIEVQNAKEDDVVETRFFKKVPVRNKAECVICCIRDRSIMANPCNHVLYCKECFENVKQKGITKCPICRTELKDYSVVYYP